MTWVLALVVGCLMTTRASAQSSPLESVTIRATLDPARHTVRGTVVQHLRNTTRTALDRLVFHLYLEAFRDDRSVFVRESGGMLRGIALEGVGGQRLLALRVDGIDRLAQARTELVPSDRTQLELPLDVPLAPGSTTTITIEFEATLPKLAVRAGYVGDFHVLAQWFPKLAKLEPDGRWASFPYHAHGEFYADFARYDVTLDVPRGFVVEGTGARVERTRRGALDRHRFVASPVHDAAYVVAPSLDVLTRECEGVALRVAHPPAYGRAAAEHAAATCAGLRELGAWLGAYPYRTLTVVLPPAGAEGGAGMEYPTAFLTDGPWYPTRGVPVLPAIETTFHELAHQWFQGIVATNEDRHPMLDEGLASYVGYEALARFRGERAPGAPPSLRDVLTYEGMRPFVAAADVPSPALESSSYGPHDYGTSVYGRTAAVLETLARTFGRSRVDAAIGRYARDHRFRHPVPEDLFVAFERELGTEVAEIARALLLRGERVAVRVERRAEGRLRVVREGPVTFPIDLEIVHGALRRRLVFRGHDRFELALGDDPGPRCLIVDPERRAVLDDRRTDDAACLERPTGTLRRRVRALLAFLLRGAGP